MTGAAPAPRGRVVEGRFEAPWWLPGAHAQTLWPALARRPPRIDWRRERFDTPDGDFLDLDHFGPGVAQSPVGLILHGLEGSSASGYVRGLAARLAGAGWHVVAMHFRGCGGEENHLPRTYHSGETGDLDAVVRHLAAQSRGRPIAVVGYSLGGNVLLKWLGEQGAAAPVAAAAAACVPMVLADAAARLEQGVSRLYARSLLRAMKRRITRKFGHDVAPPIDLRSALEATTMFEFDDRVTAPLHGFAGAADYYRRSSARQYLRSIDTPTLVVQSRDDPFMTARALPGVAELGPGVTVEVHRHGGHVGFVDGPAPWSAGYWLERRIADHLTSAMSPADRPLRGSLAPG